MYNSNPIAINKSTKAKYIRDKYIIFIWSRESQMEQNRTHDRKFNPF